MTGGTDAWRELSLDAIEAALLELRGTYDQLPPAYSARKVGGERAYRLARAGATPDLPPTEVRVYDLEVTSYAWPLATLRVDCGRGTYVRAIARDLGQLLGTAAYLTQLRRTSIGAYHVDRAVTLERLTAENVGGYLEEGKR